MAATKIDPSTAGMGPVPEANRPGHHPEVEQDKPVLPPREDPPATERFLFRFDPLMLPGAVAAGVLPARTGIEVDHEVRIRFGIWAMRFPRSAVAGAELTGPYDLLKVVGPPRLSFADGGITFATSRHEGLCIRLAEPHRGPFPFLRHAGVTVTVESPEALAEALLS